MNIGIKVNAKPRYFVTIELSEESPPLKFQVGDKAIELSPGLNKVPIALWHALGGTPEGQKLIASGSARAVCIEHVFPTLLDSVSPDPDSPWCLYCGCTRQTARVEAERRARLKTPEGKAEAEKGRAVRKAALEEHAKLAAKAVAKESE